MQGMPGREGTRWWRGGRTPSSPAPAPAPSGGSSPPDIITV